MRTLHTSLRVADPDQSLAFYRALGYEVVGRVTGTPEGDLTMIKLPDDEFVTIELVHTPLHRDPGPRAALSCLVIAVESMDTTIPALAVSGVRTEAPTSPDGSPGFLTAWITDPDGNRIELVQWPAGHAAGMSAADWPDGTESNGPGTHRRSAKDVVEELLHRQQTGDRPALDDLVAVDMVNHAAGPQGRDGLDRILRNIDEDLGPVTWEQHHLVGDGDLVVQHVTLHGTHRASTMPLLADVPVSGRAAMWTFIHIWRVADGIIVEHWACRDDMGLVEQLRA